MNRRLAIAALAAGFILISVTAAFSAPCGSEIEIQFYESQGDIFVIKNNSQESWFLVSLVIRLTGSRGGLIFDTADGGPGTSMHEPFQPVHDAVGFLGATPVGDGAEQVKLLFSDFRPAREFMFTVDVDDRLESSDFGQAVISGDEIEGAGAEAVLTRKGGGNAVSKGRFGADGRALLRGGLCV